MYQYESQIAIFYRGRSATWSAWVLRVEIYWYEYQIAIFPGELDLALDQPAGLPELSE